MTHPHPPVPPAPAAPQFNADFPHHNRPRLRPVRGFPLQAQSPDGKTVTLLGLADARQISDKVVATSPAAQLILPKMDGTRDVDTIVAEVGKGLTRPFLEGLIAQLDDAGLIEGPTFDAMLAKVREQFDASDHLPPASTAVFVDQILAQHLGRAPTDADRDEHGPARLRAILDTFIERVLKDAANPSLATLPKAIIAPHLDYPRGWMNYAAVYGRLRGLPRPDRVIVLGTNHFGEATGVCGCDKGFSTALGDCDVDRPTLDLMRARLGDALFACRYDHEREHSIELQIPWIQHIFGAGDSGRFVPVFAALVHDPSVNNGESYDGKGVALQPFVDALKEAIATLPGRTLIVSSADLSHVGPAFGDQKRLIGDDPRAEPPQDVRDLRDGVIRHDQEMLELIKQNKPAELVAAMAWQQNPTRWCSTGNIVAALMATAPAQVELFNYSAAIDAQGMAMVSSAALAIY